MKELGWQLIAWLVVHTPIGKMIVRHALKHPFKHLDGYMERYWVWNPFMQKGVVKSRKYEWGPSIRLHHILRADNERDPHDHPWNSRRIILRGWYYEEQLHFDGPEYIKNREYLTRHVRSEGHTSPLLFGQYHRIVEVSEGGVWTLFLMWDYQENWGFWQNGRKVPQRQYLGKDVSS